MNQSSDNIRERNPLVLIKKKSNGLKKEK
uniref:Uncharacterized protein n=1 Tax=Nelumbo nucifera TaxID=4432 RepID=A0A822Z4D9_NELNU|nr:TPA_asm: hypothetical protein HUJ06_013736 [Nelumbo nucifera]